jgi:methylase of polypeptide subunit release factors
MVLNSILIGTIIHFFLTFCHASTLETKYARARQTRTLLGHDIARAFYAEILTLDPRDATAATRVAAHPETIHRHSKLGKSGTLTERLAFINQLESFNFTPEAIADQVFRENTKNSETAKASSAPIYLKPLRAGSNPPPLPQCSLTACMQLFLMAVCLPVETCKDYLGEDMLRNMESLGIAFQDDDGWLIPYCHVMPVNVVASRKTLYFATDLHPDVLSTTTIQEEEGAVMYIGPDSLALLDHFHWIPSRQQPSTGTTKIVDIGSGSGIQALHLAARSIEFFSASVTSIDINPRALELTQLNFEWNGLQSPRLILGDITKPFGRIYNTDEESSWEEIMEDATMILANPPFLPVPIQDPVISKRYGLFSSGGATGDIVVERIVQLASKTLSSSSGTLAIVSEFMNPQSGFPLKLQSWWSARSSAHAVLFTNKDPMDAETYAIRRADSQMEVEQWMLHLNRESISNISPGLLFVNCKDGPDELRFSHHLVPKTDEGSLWTPTNRKARKFTQDILGSYWGGSTDHVDK